MYNAKIVLPDRDPLSPQGYARDDVSVEDSSEHENKCQRRILSGKCSNPNLPKSHRPTSSLTELQPTWPGADQGSQSDGNFPNGLSIKCKMLKSYYLIEIPCLRRATQGMT
jgi:hypothetical protein